MSLFNITDPSMFSMLGLNLTDIMQMFNITNPQSTSEPSAKQEINSKEYL